MRRLALYHLETLLWIARLGTYRAAAERLNTTQPAISARIRELESRLGMEVFRREGRNMVLTVQGRQLVQDCEPLWSAIERALLANSSFGGATGIVRVGSGEIAAASCLPGFVAQLEKQLPGVSLEITLDLTANLLQQLLGSATDIVFLAGPVASPGVRTSTIGSVGLLWLANSATAQRIKTAKLDFRLPIWSLPHHSPLHHAMREAIADGLIPHRTINTCNNVRTLIDIVSTGQGVAILPETMVREELRQNRLVEVFHSPTHQVIFQVAIRSRESDPVVLDIFRRASKLLIT